MKLAYCMTLLCLYAVTKLHWRKRESEAVMHPQIACGLFCVLLLMHANTSRSWEMSDFEWKKSSSGHAMCAKSKVNKTVFAVETVMRCISSCFTVCPSPCHAMNYWKNAKRCQHFYYIPTSFKVQPDCVFYQVNDDYRVFQEFRKL